MTNNIVVSNRSNAVRDLMKLKEDKDLIYLAGGFPDKKVLPIEILSDCYRWVLKKYGSYALEYGPTSGLNELKIQIVSYMARRGVECEQDNILVTCGSQQALDYICREYIHSSAVFVQDPCYMGAINTFSKYTTNIISLDHLEDMKDNVSLVYVNPDFSNPTGDRMPVEVRKKLIMATSQRGVYIVEDAAYTDLGHVGLDLPSILQISLRSVGYIDKSNVLYCGSFSKSISPGLRVGWVCGPTEVIQRLEQQKETNDLATSSINQLVVCRFLNRYYDAHLEWVRPHYLNKKRHMEGVLEKHLGDIASWVYPKGGFFFWVKFHESFDTEKFMVDLVKHCRVAIVSGVGFLVDPGQGAYIRISFSQASFNEVESAILSIGNIARSRYLSLSN